MARDVLLFYHTHTPDSNRFEREVRGLDIDSHAVDYVDVVRRLPENLDAVFVKTDHWKTDSGYFDRLESRLEDEDTSLDRFDAHVCFELTGSTATVINGVEASVRSQQYHVTIGGLPIANDETFHNLSFEELRRIATRAGWIAPAHIGMPFHVIPEDLMRELCELATSGAVEVALGYTTGYFPIWNRLSRNEIPLRKSVRYYAERYDLSLLPELDLHGVVPAGLSGCGVVESSAIEDLETGRLPVEKIFAADVLRPDGCRNGITVREFLRNYGVFVPLVPTDSDVDECFRRSFPSKEWLRELNVPANTVSLP